MLRITRHNTPEAHILQVEGRLAGAWVAILRDCWQQQLTQRDSHAIYVDLRGVTFVDAAGKALLSEMAGQHAQFYASDCEMKATLDEIA